MAGDVKYLVNFTLYGWICQSSEVSWETIHANRFLFSNCMTCTMFKKVCKSVSDLKRHMLHNHQIPSADLINLVGRASFLCYICFRLCGSTAGLMNHLRRHECWGVDGKCMRLWDSNDYIVAIYIYIYIYILNASELSI